MNCSYLVSTGKSRPCGATCEGESTFCNKHKGVVKVKATKRAARDKQHDADIVQLNENFKALKELNFNSASADATVESSSPSKMHKVSSRS
jgi:hypothetical protein